MFFFRFAAYALLIAVLVLLCYFFFPFLLHPHVWYAYAYNLVLVAASYAIFNRGVKKNSVESFRYFMGASAFRLLTSAVVLLLYILWIKAEKHFSKSETIHFLTIFFIFYIFFTVFEINALLSKLRKK